MSRYLSTETASRLKTEAAALSSSTKALSRQRCPWRSQLTTRYSTVFRGIKTVRRRRSATASEMRKAVVGRGSCRKR